MKTNYPLISFKHEAFQEYKNECSLVLWNWKCSKGCSWCSLKNVLNKQKNILDVDYLGLIENTTRLETAVVFLGGEPFENLPGLILGCAAAKKRGLKTKVFTAYISHEVEVLIDLDYVNAISFDIKESLFNFDGITLGLLIQRCNKRNIDVDLRCTIHPKLSEKELDEIRKIVKIFKNDDLKFEYYEQRYIEPIGKINKNE